jgi:hypothetical protein
LQENEKNSFIGKFLGRLRRHSNSNNKFFTLREAFDNKCGHGILAAKEVAPGSAVYIAAVR